VECIANKSTPAAKNHDKIITTQFELGKANYKNPQTKNREKAHQAITSREIVIRQRKTLNKEHANHSLCTYKSRETKTSINESRSTINCSSTCKKKH